MADIKDILKKTWHFIWYDDSPLSWLVNIALAFIIIKYLFYPALGFVLGTSFPIVAVVSNSMEHTSGFGEWWAENEDYYLAINITKEAFEEYPFKNGFDKGDIMVLVGKRPADVHIGDVIVFQSRKPYPIIHRVIKKDDKGMIVFETKGDNNKGQIVDIELNEKQVLERQLIGEAAFRIPWLGYVKIWFVDLLRFIGFKNVF